MKRLLGKDPAPYARKVVSELFREGFTPQALEEMNTLGTLRQDSRMFGLLAERRLEPGDAAFAIQLAIHRYLHTRHFAETLGWPSNRRAEASCPPHEAYFLDLLDEAAQALSYTQPGAFSAARRTPPPAATP